MHAMHRQQAGATCKDVVKHSKCLEYSVTAVRRRTCCKAAQVDAAPGQQSALSKEGLVFPRGQPGSWDEAGVGSPVVRCYVGDNEQRWLMWYSGRTAGAPALDAVVPSSGSIGVAISSDGVNWRRSVAAVQGEQGASAALDVGTVLEPCKDWWTFDTCHLAAAEVQILSNASVGTGVGVYWMFYSGGDFEPVPVSASVGASGSSRPLPPGVAEHAEQRQAAASTSGSAPDSGAIANSSSSSSSSSSLPPGVLTLEGLRCRPGLAMSQDGRNWARIEADHHTGALFDVGAKGEWDELFIGCPQVIACGPRDMRMFYHSWDPRRGRYVIGLATSPDGFKWVKKGVVFDPVAATAGSTSNSSSDGAHDAFGAAAHYVVRDPDSRQYVMFYEAVAADEHATRTIGLAVSKDGLSGWKRCPKPILQASGDASAWDSGSVGAPCAVSMSAGRWRLYYGARKEARAGPWDGVGLALSAEGAELFQGVPCNFKRRTGSAAGV